MTSIVSEHEHDILEFWSDNEQQDFDDYDDSNLLFDFVDEQDDKHAQDEAEPCQWLQAGGQTQLTTLSDQSTYRSVAMINTDD